MSENMNKGWSITFGVWGQPCAGHAAWSVIKGATRLLGVGTTRQSLPYEASVVSGICCMVPAGRLLGQIGPRWWRPWRVFVVWIHYFALTAHPHRLCYRF
jgi:hypothetical protein